MVKTQGCCAPIGAFCCSVPCADLEACGGQGGVVFGFCVSMRSAVSSHIISLFSLFMIICIHHCYFCVPCDLWSLLWVVFVFLSVVFVSTLFFLVFLPCCLCSSFFLSWSLCFSLFSLYDPLFFVFRMRPLCSLCSPLCSPLWPSFSL